jgi:heterotetrameric sarcosine oxidase gamma subunit
LVVGAIGTSAPLTASWHKIADVAAVLDDSATVVDLTHGRALVRVRGQATVDLLAKVCAVDLDDQMPRTGRRFAHRSPSSSPT